MSDTTTTEEVVEEPVEEVAADEPQPLGTADLRAAIFAVDDIQEQYLTVPEWGGIRLLIRGMIGEERAQYMARFTDDDGKINYRELYPNMIVRTCFNPNSPDERVFTEEDITALNQKSGAALERVAQVGTKLSGLDSEAEDRAGNDS